MDFNQADKVFQKPLQIASITNLRNTWKYSKDSKGVGGARGVDGVTAYTFSNRLETNFHEIRKDLLNGTYEFEKLRAFTIVKKSGKERIICIPTIRDRLVQRLILRRLTGTKGQERDRLKNRTDINFDSTHNAIKTALKYRNKNGWVIKTDISRFFDQIPRDELKKRLRRKLGASSLVPLIEKAINCELENPKDQELTNTIKENGIKAGVGLRQGMPLSSLLSNLILNKFDRAAARKGLKLIRYADDIIAFASEENEAEDIFSFIEVELKKVELEIPTLEAHDKSEIFSPNKNVPFLGVDIYLNKKNKKYDRKIPNETRDKAREKIHAHKDLSLNLKNGYSYADVIRRLKDIPEGYSSAFGDCTNLDSLLDLLKKESVEVKQHLISEIFGEEVYARLSVEEKDFLGF